MLFVYFHSHVLYEIVWNFNTKGDQITIGAHYRKYSTLNPFSIFETAKLPQVEWLQIRLIHACYCYNLQFESFCQPVFVEHEYCISVCLGTLRTGNSYHYSVQTLFWNRFCYLFSYSTRVLTRTYTLIKNSLIAHKPLH